VSDWLSSLDMKPVSQNTYFRHFKAALNQAVAWDYLKANPCTKVKTARVDELPPRCLTREEVIRLLSAEDDPRFHRLWRFLLATGARRSEALQIRAEDIKQDQKLITVRVTKKRKARDLTITGEGLAILKEFQSQEVGKLFPWRPDTVTHHFHKTAVKAGVQARLHDLRHTYGTVMAKQVDPWVLQKLMGHADIQTTQRYVHVNLADLVETT
jgi:integrase